VASVKDTDEQAEGRINGDAAVKMVREKIDETIQPEKIPLISTKSNQSFVTSRRYYASWRKRPFEKHCRP
jgi:hypothetical protein